jgi:hypothetical protein
MEASETSEMAAITTCLIRIDTLPTFYFRVLRANYAFMVCKSLNAQGFYLWWFDAEIRNFYTKGSGRLSRLACIAPFWVMKILRICAGFAVLAALSTAFVGSAYAATAQPRLNVALTILESCRVQSSADAVQVRCSLSAPTKVETIAPAAIQTADGLSGARAVVITY